MSQNYDYVFESFDEPMVNPATVVGYLDGLVLFADEDDRFFYLEADPAAFELGIDIPSSTLKPFETAPENLQKKILAWKNGGE